MCRCFGKQIAAHETAGWDVASFWHHEQVAGPRCGHVDHPSPLCVEVGALSLPDAQSRWFLPGELGKIYHPTAAIALHAPRAALRAGIPPALAVPDRNDREFESLGLVHGDYLNRFCADRMWRVELNRAFHPLA